MSGRESLETRLNIGTVQYGHLPKHLHYNYGFVRDLWLSGLCTGIPVIDPEFDPGHKPVFSFLSNWVF